MTNIIVMEFGSPVYGTALPTSDTDYKGIYLPAPKDIVLGRVQESINSTTKPEGQLKNDSSCIDSEIFSLKKYMKLLLEGQTVALTMLFIPQKHIVECRKPEEWEFIQKHKDKWLHKGVTAFAGYCRQQANKYGIKGSRVAASRAAMDFFGIYSPSQKLKDIWDEVEKTFTGMEHCEFVEDYMRGNPEYKVRMLSVCNRKVQEHITCKEAHKIYKHLFDEYGQRALAAEKQEGVDWKALAHAVRVAGEAKELLITSNITYPRPDADLLLQIRKGELKYEAVAELIEQGLYDLETYSKISLLPTEPDYDFAEDYVFHTYETVIINNEYWRTHGN